MDGISIWHIIMFAVVVGLLLLVLIYPMGRILSRAGWSPWLALLWFVPFLNVILLWVFAFGEWPAVKRPE